MHEESGGVTALCGAVEACLGQGLRRRALGLFKTSSTTALLHKIAKVSANDKDVCDGKLFKKGFDFVLTTAIELWKEHFNRPLKSVTSLTTFYLSDPLGGFKKKDFVMHKLNFNLLMLVNGHAVYCHVDTHPIAK